MSRLDRMLWRLIDQVSLPTWGWLHQPWLGLVLAFGYVALAEVWHNYGRVTLAPMFLILVVTVYLGGFWYGLAVVWLNLICEWHFWPGETARNLVVFGTMAATLLVVSILQRKAALVDSLDANIQELERIEREQSYTLAEWEYLERRRIREQLEGQRHQVRQLLTRAKGWQELADKVRTVREVIKCNQCGKWRR